MPTIRKGFAKSLRKVRKARGLTQEDFWEVSGRTYIGALEAGLKSPTLDKVEELATSMNVHPLTLVAMAYVEKKSDLKKLLTVIEEQITDLLNVEE